MLDNVFFLWYYAGIAEWSAKELEAIGIAIATFVLGYFLIVYTITWKGRR